MNCCYDLHLHSCLSPCGDDDMTPYNLVQMAKLKGLDIIALTDHNTVKNCGAAMRVGERAGIAVVPGMELCTSEEIHVVCLFPDLAGARAFDGYVEKCLGPVRNAPDIFGRQLMMDEQDRVLGEYDLLLVAATSIGIDEVTPLCDRFGGICFPAHVDRESYSIVSSLGMIPPELHFRAAELTPRAGDDFLKKHPVLQSMRILRSSDAHRLEDIAEPEQRLELPQCTARALIDLLRPQ